MSDSSSIYKRISFFENTCGSKNHTLCRNQLDPEMINLAKRNLWNARGSMVR